MPTNYKKRNYKKRRNNTTAKTVVARKLRIPRPINNRLGRTATMNLTRDFLVYVDPKLSADDSTGIQKSMSIRLCVNSVYPFLESTAHGSPFLKTPNAVMNFELPPTPYNLDSPNPAGATIMPGLYEQGDYSVARKYEQAYISGAKVTVFQSAVALQHQAAAQQPGLITLFASNTDVNPFGLDTANKELKLLVPRITRRVEPQVTAVASSRAQTNTKNIKVAMGVSIAKLNHVTNINDDLESFGFSLGQATDTGPANTAGVPLKKSYVDINYIPSLSASMTGNNTQAPSSVFRIRLQQKITFVSQKSHSNVPGVSFNLPRAKTNYGYAKAMMAGGYAASQFITANRQNRLFIRR